MNEVKCNNERIVPVEIGGKTMFFNFSVNAAEEMMRTDLMEMAVTDEDGKVSGEDVQNILSIYALLLSEGAEYVNLMCEGSVDEYSARELGTILSMDDINRLAPEMNKAIEKGCGQEVLAQPKNGESQAKAT